MTVHERKAKAVGCRLTQVRGVTAQWFSRHSQPSSWRCAARQREKCDIRLPQKGDLQSSNLLITPQAGIGGCRLGLTMFG